MNLVQAFFWMIDKIDAAYALLAIAGVGLLIYLAHKNKPNA